VHQVVPSVFQKQSLHWRTHFGNCQKWFWDHSAPYWIHVSVSAAVQMLRHCCVSNLQSLCTVNLEVYKYKTQWTIKAHDAQLWDKKWYFKWPIYKESQGTPQSTQLMHWLQVGLLTKLPLSQLKNCKDTVININASGAIWTWDHTTAQLLFNN
jgi:hypothetical protein